MSKLCPSCGKENNDNMLFCGYCGSRFPVTEVPEETVYEETTDDISVAEPEEVYEEPAEEVRKIIEEKPKKVSKRKDKKEEKPEPEPRGEGEEETTGKEKEAAPAPDDGGLLGKNLSNLYRFQQSFLTKKKKDKKEPKEKRNSLLFGKNDSLLKKGLKAAGVFLAALILLAWLSGRLMSGKEIDNTPTVTRRVMPTNAAEAKNTETPTPEPTSTPTPILNPVVTEVPSDYLPSDYGTVWDGSVALYLRNGKGIETDPFVVSCASEFALIAKEVNNGNSFRDAWFYVDSDIDFGGLEWTPIGYYYDYNGTNLVNSFEGTIIGNGHVFSNYKITTAENVKKLAKCSKDMTMGFFGAVTGAKIYDLSFERFEIQLNGTNEIVAGGIVGYVGSGTNIERCKAEGKINVSSVGRISAGLVSGFTSSSTLVECESGGSIVAGGNGVKDVGLFTGFASDVKISSSKAKGTIDSTSVDNLYAGGFCGYAKNVEFNVNSVTVTSMSAKASSATGILAAGGAIGAAYNCKDNYFTINTDLKAEGNASVFAGGSTGYMKDTECSYTNLTAKCTFTSNSTLDTMLCGGIAGYSEGSLISHVVSSADITAASAYKNFCGGIAGTVKGGKIINSDCSASVSTSSTGNTGEIRAGGVAGNILNGLINNTFSGGGLTSVSSNDSCVGGAFGYMEDSSCSNLICDSFIDNSAVHTVASGGIAAYSRGNCSLNGCVGSVSRKNKGGTVYDDVLIAISY